MEMIRVVGELRAIAAKLELGRKDEPIINDMFEAADDWRDLGEVVLEDKGVDLSGRVKQEVELFDRLGALYGSRIEQNADYAKIMTLGARVIAAGKAYEPPPGGYLGSMRIVRDTFSFLQTEFGLAPGPEPQEMWNYASKRVRVEVRLPTPYDSSCWVRRLSEPGEGFQLEDLLFMGGRSVSLTLPPGQKIATEADVQDWFTTVADILRKYGADVLADRPGAFERLARAAAERERMINEECERLYSSGKSGVSKAV